MLSSERPLVSGISFQVNQSAGEQQMANSQNVHDDPSPSSMSGVSWPTKKLPTHNESVASAMALPRMAFGKISPITTQQTGPNEKAKHAIKVRMNSSIHGPDVRPAANNVPIRMSEITAPPIPTNKSGLLPHRSTVKMATKVK